ncbi:MAG: hypothetical protein HOO96_23125 [Polyangiaceae bacterium]|nr:hypothetical protein [Polyangiaceae bacterium]
MKILSARLHDPRGPRWLGFVWIAFALMLFVGGFLATGLPALAGMLFALCGVALNLGPFFPLRWAPVIANVELHPGALRIRNAGLRDREVTAKQVQGATTARSDGGVMLHLGGVAEGGTPLALEFDSDDEAAQAREALGIGHHGFGKLSWEPSPGDASGGRNVFRIISAVLFFLCAASAAGAAVESSWWALYAVCTTFGVITLGLGALLSMLAWSSPRVHVSSDGVSFDAGGVGRFIRWGDIATVNHAKDHVALSYAHGHPPLVVPTALTRWSRRGMAAADQEAFLAVVQSGARRARGEGPRKEEVAARIEVLQRGGAASRDWLARLDVEAQRLQAGGYRGSVMDKDDLYRVLGDPDADTEIRAAAARILLRVDPSAARVRVDHALATSRDPTEEARIRLATESDLERAGEALDQLPAAPPPRAASRT